MFTLCKSKEDLITVGTIFIYPVSPNVFDILEDLRK